MQLPKNLEPGDLIEVKKEGKIYRGRYIPKPELLRENIIILKLENGYNIGLKITRDLEIKLIKKASEKAEREEKKEEEIPTGDVLIYAVGGTICSRVDYRTGGVHALFDPNEILERVPELKDICTFSIEKREPLKMSEDLLPRDWIDIARNIYKRYNEFQGFVILHGTDTMHYTSAALSFFFRNLGKPIIITGSQRSSDRGSSDAFTNLIASCIAATRWDGAEVAICMHANLSDEYNFLMRGTRVRKLHTERRDAFRPVNEPPLAKIFLDGRIEIINKEYRKRGDYETFLDTKIDEKVIFLKFYPGFPPELIEWASEKYHGIVIEGTGFGHVNSLPEYGLIEAIKKSVEKGVPVVITSQTIFGRTNEFVYTNLRKLSLYAGAIFCGDMLPEVAYIKLMWVLGKTREIEKVKELMRKNFAGEISKRSYLS